MLNNTQHNDIKQNDIEHDTYHEGTKHNNPLIIITKHYDQRYNLT